MGTAERIAGWLTPLLILGHIFAFFGVAIRLWDHGAWFWIWICGGGEIACGTAYAIVTWPIAWVLAGISKLLGE